MNKGYEKIAEALLAAEVDGAWSPPWHSSGLTTPQNAITGRCYSGMNVVLCWASQQQHSFGTQLWATYQQWLDAGAQVRKGSKSTHVIFFKSVERENAEGGKDKGIVARSFNLFNRDQVVGAPALPVFDLLPESERIARVEHFVARVPAEVESKESDRAYYSRTDDKVVVPLFGQFKQAEGYYSTLLHELSHWTGHKDREAREMGKRFGDEAYAMEEMVAELSAVFLATDLGLQPDIRPDHAKYIQSWHRRLKEDPAGFAHAVALAQRAATCLRQHGTEDVYKELVAA